MLRRAIRVLLLVVLVPAPLVGEAQPPPPAFTASQMAAADLGRRLDELQALLAVVRDAPEPALRQAAMERHWSGLQGYMEHSLKLLVQHASPKGSVDAVGCGLAGGQWRNLSFPGQLSASAYLGLMKNHAGRMRQDVLAMQSAQQPYVLEAVMREHWRANYAFVQRTRGLGWMFDGWMPAAPGDRHPPEPESEGARLTVTFCSVCHAVPHARLHTAGEWDAVMSQMDRHIALSDTGVPKCVAVPSAIERTTIRDYLVRHAR